MGMGRKLIESRLPSVEQLFNSAEEVLGYCVRTLFLKGPQSLLDQTVHCQPAVLIASLAAVEDMKHKDPQVLN